MGNETDKVLDLLEQPPPHICQYCGKIQIKKKTGSTKCAWHLGFSHRGELLISLCHDCFMKELTRRQP